MEPRTIDTPQGPARAHSDLVEAAAGAIVLGHGAGGSVDAPDLVAAVRAANASGWSAVRVEQPYRVAGRRGAPPAPRLDEAWLAVLADLRSRELDGLAVVCGGRSSGARVACRTAVATGAAAVLCLAFPLITPKGASRQSELDAAGVPILVVQGRGDRFGVPRASSRHRREVVRLRGDHGLKSDAPGLRAAVSGWLERLG